MQDKTKIPAFQLTKSYDELAFVLVGYKNDKREGAISLNDGDLPLDTCSELEAINARHTAQIISEVEDEMRLIKDELTRRVHTPGSGVHNCKKCVHCPPFQDGSFEECGDGGYVYVDGTPRYCEQFLCI